MSSGQFRFDIQPQDVKRNVGLAMLGLGAVILLLLLSKSWYTVEANEKAVVLRFGRYVTTSDPGLHFCIPFVDTVLTADTRERMIRMPFGLADDRQGGQANEEDVLMLTGDLNAAAVEWTVQWQVADPQQYLFTFHTDLAEQEEFLQYIITVVGRTVMNRLVGDYSIDEVLTGARMEIREAAREATQAMLDKYECGIRITDLQLQRVTPPSKVAPAFSAIQEAVQTSDKLENEANKLKNTLLPKARAERDKLIRGAEGYAARRRSEVKGEIDALMVQYEQFAKAPEETRQRLYLESLQDVLSNVENKTIIDSDLRQLLPLLNLGEGSN
jgi:membrane protease subunit HflK